MANIIDARGLKCPEPAIRTGRALKEYDEITVIVDDKTAITNISRGVKKRGYEVNVKEEGKDFYLDIKKGENALEKNLQPENDFDFTCENGEIVVFFASDKIGSGDDELGGILTRSIIYSFTEVEPKPTTMIFMNNGVKLAIENSEVLDDLIKLNKMGVDILVCGTCLDYFGLKDKLAIGEISNAYTISETLLEAGKVVKF